VHLTADVMHLIAAAAWMGGLIPLTLLLSQASRTKVDPWPSLAWQVTGRFSFLGMVSVGTITASGIVNAWMLVGSFRGLFVTEYGWLLMLKVLLFVIMLSYAAINRLVLTPELAVPRDDDTRLAAMARLTHNSNIEIAVGLTILQLSECSARCIPPFILRTKLAYPEHPFAETHRCLRMGWTGRAPAPNRSENKRGLKSTRSTSPCSIRPPLQAHTPLASIRARTPCI